MKIIHTGDVHLGGAFEGLPSEKANLRKAEILSGFRRLCTFAKEEKVGAVLLAGDLFDGDFVSKQTVQEAFLAISSANPVPFFFVSGNHDCELDLKNGAPKNLYFFEDGKGYQLSENITVSGLNASEFSASKWQSLALRADAFNILLLHGEISKDFSISSLRGKGIDYLALGHIHKPDLQARELDARGKYRYCGCLEGRGFDEMGDRGFFLLEVEKSRISSERFLSLASRKVQEIAFNITPFSSYFQMESEAVALLKGQNPNNLYKIVLTGCPAPTLKKDLKLLEARLAPFAFFVRVEDKSKPFISFKAFENDLTERGEFVRAVGRSALSEEWKAEILEVGLKALAGEEIDL